MKSFGVSFAALLCVLIVQPSAAPAASAQKPAAASEQPAVSEKASGSAPPTAKKPSAFEKPSANETGGAKQPGASDTDRSESRKETLLYGLESEAVSLLDTLIKEKDDSFSAELERLFPAVKTTALRDKIIAYYTEFEDPVLKEYALEALADPYDEKKSTINALIKYAEKIKLREAAPLLRALIENENEAFFDSSIIALGTVGSEEDAVFLAEWFDKDITVAQKQSVVKALGKIKAEKTWDKLVETAKDEEENGFVRMYAAEAIGNIKPDEASAVLVELFDSTDPNLRQYVIKGLSHSKTDTAHDVFLAALKDNHYKVRLEAVRAVKEQEYKDALPYLLYRAKNDAENAVKYECFDALAFFTDKDGIDYMIGILKDARRGDTLKVKAAASLLKYNAPGGVEAVVELAEKSLADDKKKALRYALGKEFAKYENAKFETVCAAYIKSADVATKATGLDIYKKNRFTSVLPLVQSIAEEEKPSSIRSKAKALLDSAQ